jgi:hypothetical protein
VVRVFLISAANCDLGLEIFEPCSAVQSSAVFNRNQRQIQRAARCRAIQTKPLAAVKSPATSSGYFSAIADFDFSMIEARADERRRRPPRAGRNK